MITAVFEKLTQLFDHSRLVITTNIFTDEYVFTCDSMLIGNSGKLEPESIQQN